jgi:hypothetical protein
MKHRGTRANLLTQLMQAEWAVEKTLAKLQRLRDPVKRVEALWKLGWGPLRNLEDLRPPGGFR